MSDVVWQAAIGGVVTIFVAVLHERTNRKLKSIAETGEKTHTLVNSNMGQQLKLNATVTHRLALLTGDPTDEAVAVESRKKLDEHEARQGVVDRSQADPGTGQ